MYCHPVKHIGVRQFTVLCDKGDSTIAERLKIIMDQREAVEEEITKLQDALDVLKYKTWLYEVALDAGTTAVHDNMPLEKMPPSSAYIPKMCGEQISVKFFLSYIPVILTPVLKPYSKHFVYVHK